MVGPINPHLEDLSCKDSMEEVESRSVTDRYIPARKLLKKDSIYQDDE